jgi:hypothetical protein
MIDLQAVPLVGGVNGGEDVEVDAAGPKMSQPLRDLLEAAAAARVRR